MAIYPPTFVKTQVLGLILGLSNELYALAECESGFNTEAIGKAGEIGLFQYLPSTWNWFNEIRGTDLDIYNPDHQRDMTEWAWQNDLESHWTCYNIVKGR